jgi:plastocyanin
LKPPIRQSWVVLKGWVVLTLLGAVYADSASAVIVTIGATSQSGAIAEDAVIVFDPLDDVPPPSHAAAIIDQVNKRFVPRVSVIRTGTAVSFPNSDSIRHQVYSFSKPHPFNLKLYAGSPRMDIMFDKPGMVILGCNIHDTMVAFVAVVDSPYFAKIPQSGVAKLDLPAGRYRLRVWHPSQTAAVAQKEITIGGEPLSIPVTIELGSPDGPPTAWPE